LPDDTWDAPSGRHRQVSARNRRYLWTGGLLVIVAVLVTAVMVPLLRPGESAVPGPLAGGPTSGSGTSPPGAPATTTGLAMIATAPPTTTTRPAATPARTNPSAVLLAFEAEGASPVERKFADPVPVAGASGGEAVRFNHGWPAQIRFHSLAVPSKATYRVTIAYAPDTDRRMGWLTATGMPVLVTFAGGTGCCATVSVTVTLAPNDTLSIGPLGSGWTGDDHRPAIDGITIVRG
jgi:hypothetical protein